MYHIKTTKEMGRGLYASSDLKRGTVIMRCELLVLSQKDTVSINKTDLKFYTFSYLDGCDCLVLGDGEIFNHSSEANTLYKLVPVEDRKCMLFVLNKDISKGEQLFIDYQADVVETDIEAYKNQKSLI